MRKFQKQQLLDVITSLHLLHQEIRDRLAQKEYQTVHTALSDCQEAAIQVGEAIEQMAGTGTEAVAYLEKYCEKLYQVSMQLENIQAQKVYKSIESILIKAENAINHISVRKEVVFLPYKASMWDSLESVYFAVREDENCDAYVVPIPYYEKRADGSLGEMHYEGDVYPKNIEIMDYRTYNLEERHPDTVYIHNPYDEWNNVTCVPERYFSRNLCHHTDCLVYIPYFVLGETNANNQNDVDSMKHFCFLPGTIYSHKVIVQSENMRQIYINEYIKAAKPLGLPADRKMLEEKILGTGSPKYDKVQNTGKEDLDIPAEWLKVIEKPDGTWKKIIFYNTSINALLRYDERMFEKMKGVFRIFKEHQDEVVLLWRPHPLIPNTIKSMRPQLWTEYAEIVETYRQEKWGIYDDSADMDRAVLLSDGYYGDHSSVVHLYKKTCKPVMIQGIDIIEDYDAISPIEELGDCIITNEKICWYNRNSIILQVEKDGKRDISVWVYTGESIAASEFDKKIYFAPMAGNEIRILDLNTQEMNYVELPDYACAGILNKFYQARKYNNSIYFLPGKYPYIVEYDLTENRVKRYDLDLSKIGAVEGDLISFESSYIYNDKIFLASANSGILCSFDMRSSQRDYFHITDSEGFTTICGSENRLYLADKEGNIFKGIVEDKEIRCEKIFEDKGVRFRKSFCWNNKIIMFMEKTEECVVIDVSNDACEIISLSKNDDQEYNGNKYGEPKLINDKFYIFNKMKKTIITFDKNMAIENYQVDDIDEKLSINCDSRMPIAENYNLKFNTLQFYILAILCSPDRKFEISNKDSVGKIIKKIIEG